MQTAPTTPTQSPGDEASAWCPGGVSCIVPPLAPVPGEVDLRFLRRLTESFPKDGDASWADGAVAAWSDLAFFQAFFVGLADCARSCFHAAPFSARRQ